MLCVSTLFLLFTNLRIVRNLPDLLARKGNLRHPQKETGAGIFQFLEGFFNRTRRYTFLNYLFIFDFELLYLKLVA